MSVCKTLFKYNFHPSPDIDITWIKCPPWQDDVSFKRLRPIFPRSRSYAKVKSKSRLLSETYTSSARIIYDDAGPRSAVGNVSGYRYVSDCRSRGREFDPGPVPYFRGDWSWNDLLGHSPPFRWFIQEGLLSVTSESMCTNYWVTACSSLPRKKCG